MRLQTLQEFTNLGPVLDFEVVDLDHIGQGQIVACCNSGRFGSLRLIRNGIGISEQASIELEGALPPLLRFQPCSPNQSLVCEDCVLRMQGKKSQIRTPKCASLAATIQLCMAREDFASDRQHVKCFSTPTRMPAAQVDSHPPATMPVSALMLARARSRRASYPLVLLASVPAEPHGLVLGPFCQMQYLANKIRGRACH
jgi:hypothetical protein